MSIRAGKLRHQITIERRVLTQDSTGDPLQTWEVFARRRASVEPLVGNEFFISKARAARVPTKFRLRYLDGVLPNMRILWEINSTVKVFNITDVTIVHGIQHEMLIIAEELVGDPA
jgi:SPP1 family predicted phage head-tail adaptor